MSSSVYRVTDDVTAPLRFPSDASAHRSESAELHGPEMLHLHGGPWRHPAESAMKLKPPNESNALQTGGKHLGVLHYKHEITETQSLEAL